MEFNLVHLAITVRSENVSGLAAALPLLGSSFATTCRNLVCRFPVRVCNFCPLVESCPWYLVFGQKLSTDPAELKRHQKPALPFMFSFPVLPLPAESGTEIQCGLVVVGRAIPQLTMLLDGFAELLASAACPDPAEITSVGSRDYQGTLQPLSDGGGIRHPKNLVVLSSSGLLECRVWVGATLDIRLLSPLRLFDNGHLLDRFDFSLFARSLMRRVSSLAYYYGAYESNCDFKALSCQARAVTCSDSNFSSATDKGRKMSGINGYGSFRGDFSGIMPFLVLGLYMHAGKGASFGMGMYEMIPGSTD